MNKPILPIDLPSTLFALNTSIITGNETAAIVHCSKLLTIPNISAEAIALELVKMAPTLIRRYKSRYERMMNAKHGSKDMQTKQYWLLLIVIEFLGTVESVRGWQMRERRREMMRVEWRRREAIRIEMQRREEVKRREMMRVEMERREMMRLEMQGQELRRQAELRGSIQQQNLAAQKDLNGLMEMAAEIQNDIRFAERGQV